MRRLSLLAGVALVVYTVMAIVYYDSFPSLTVVQVGDNRLVPFDFLFWFSVLLLAIGFLGHSRAGFSSRTRPIGYLVAAYMAYQLLVVVPVTVAKGTYPPLAALYAVTPRLSIVFVPFFALLVTRHWNGRMLSLMLEGAALALFMVAAWRFLTGSTVTYEEATGRLRVLWGGGTLLFGWLLVSRLFRERPKGRDLAFGLAGLVGILLINHRSAYIALIVSILAYVIARRRHTVRTIAVVMLAVGLVTLFILAFVPSLQSGLAYSFETFLNPNADANAGDRVERSQLGLQAFAAYPLGDVLWRPSSNYYLVDLGTAFFEPHNFVVQLLVKEGLVGFLAWSALLALALRAAFRNAQHDHASAVLGAYVVFYLVFCLFNANFYMSNNIVLLTAPLGLIVWRDRVVSARALQVCPPTDVIAINQPSPATAHAPTPCANHASTPRRRRGARRFSGVSDAHPTRRRRTS
jgi:O-antigen ligase